MSALTDFWASIDGPVHSADREVLNQRDPAALILNRDFPPPAFVGDVDNAPIIILMSNGGFDAQQTPAEFPDQKTVQGYINYLRRPRPIEPGLISPYYARHYAAPLIRQGSVAIVNACAYRSNRAMNSTGRLKTLANLLPSVLTARSWAQKELVSAASSGDRLVIVHRPGLWNFPPGDGPNFVQAVDPEWARKALPYRFRVLIEHFLKFNSPPS